MSDESRMFLRMTMPSVIVALGACIAMLVVNRLQVQFTVRGAPALWPNAIDNITLIGSLIWLLVSSGQFYRLWKWDRQG
jgi:hypothetical protein